MPTMTGGQALVRSLIREGVDTIFGLPGVQLDWAFDALHEHRDEIRVIHTRHEQATSYMAYGYAQTTGKVGVCLVVPGPGLLNAAAGLSTAYSASSPVLCIAGQIDTGLIGKDHGALHEIKDQIGMVASVTKWAALASKPGEVPGVVREAFDQLGSGRPRPVEIEVPPDVLMGTQEVELAEPGPITPVEGDSKELDRAADLLGAAKRPIIYAGSGVITSGATDELRVLSEMLGAPIAMSPNAKGAISSEHPLALTAAGGYEMVPEADVILAVGTRFSMPSWLGTSWKLGPDQKFIHLDIDEDEVGRTSTPTVGIVSDARRGLSEITRRVSRHDAPRESQTENVQATRDAIDEKLGGLSPLTEYAAAIREALPRDGILVDESTQVGYYSREGFPVYEPRTYVTSGYQGTLGYGFATALGAKVGNPDKAVVSINGDGGFMYNVQELATMVQHQIGAVAIVFNDNAFGNVRRTQDTRFDGHIIATDLHNPDFVALAHSFGVAGIRATDPDQLLKVLKHAIETDAPTLIEVPLGVMPSPSFLPPADIQKHHKV